MFLWSVPVCVLCVYQLQPKCLSQKWCTHYVPYRAVKLQDASKDTLCFLLPSANNMTIIKCVKQIEQNQTNRAQVCKHSLISAMLLQQPLPQGLRNIPRMAEAIAAQCTFFVAMCCIKTCCVAPLLLGA